MYTTVHALRPAPHEADNSKKRRSAGARGSAGDQVRRAQEVGPARSGAGVVGGAVGGAVGVFAVGEARGVVFLGLLADGRRSVRLVRTLAIVVIVGGMVVVGVCAVIVGVVIVVAVVAVGLVVVVGDRGGGAIGTV